MTVSVHDDTVSTSKSFIKFKKQPNHIIDDSYVLELAKRRVNISSLAI